jgi:nitrogen-specific signal transduction histidine kinase
MIISILITVMSIYLIKDLLVGHRLANQISMTISLTALLWLIANLTDTFHPYAFQVSVCIVVGILYFLFILTMDNMNFLAQPVKKMMNLGMFLFWMAHLYLVLHVYLWDVFLISDTALSVSVLGVGLLLFYGLNKSSHSIYGVRLLNRFRFEILFIFTYLIMLTYWFFINEDYLGSPRLAHFYILYGLFFLPHCILRPIRCLHLYLKAGLMAGFFLIFSWCLYVALSLIGYPQIHTPFQWLFFLITSLVLIGFFHIFDRIVSYTESLPPFSMIDHASLDSLMHHLKSVTQRSDIQGAIETFKPFKFSKYRAHIWEVDHHLSTQLSMATPELDPEIISFMHYKEIILYEDLPSLLQKYAQTPLNASLRLLHDFMLKHSIIRISLLQKSRETKGIFAVSVFSRRREILDADHLNFKLFETVLSNALSNVQSVGQLLNHQHLLEQINVASSKFHISMDEASYYSIIRRTMMQIIPEIKFYFLLTYDADSEFYRRSFLLTKKYDQYSLKIHGKDIASAFNNNMYVTFTMGHRHLPKELKIVMQKTGATQSILIRLDEAFGSPVFVLFFDAKTDLMDYRVPFCQVFLRQSHLFYQYQSNYEELKALQLFLKLVLDQLPTGILIVDAQFKLTYKNTKMMTFLGDGFSDSVECNLRDVGIPHPLIDAIKFVASNKSDYSEKHVFDFFGKPDLYLVSSFQVFQDNDEHFVLVLTNIQQSKELIDRMNQTNRLAMMSKIAKGISYELSKPVNQLIEGVSKIQQQWQDPQFQDCFSTDIIPQVDRINLLCQSLLRLSRSNTESLVEIFLPDLLDQVFRLIAGDLRYSTQRFYVGAIDREWVILDQVMVIQVLMNLMLFSLNSLAKDSSRLTLDILLPSHQLLTIKIQISDYLQDGFSDEETMKGQLELSIVNQIVMNQNGQFDIFSENNLASFHIHLPVKKFK